MKKVSLDEMRKNHSKFAWRIAFTGFTKYGEPEFYLLSKKEALKVNPKKEYSYNGEDLRGE